MVNLNLHALSTKTVDNVTKEDIYSVDIADLLETIHQFSNVTEDITDTLMRIEQCQFAIENLYNIKIVVEEHGYSPALESLLGDTLQSVGLSVSSVEGFGQKIIDGIKKIFQWFIDLCKKLWNFISGKKVEKAAADIKTAEVVAGTAPKDNKDEKSTEAFGDAKDRERKLKIFSDEEYKVYVTSVGAAELTALCSELSKIHTDLEKAFFRGYDHPSIPYISKMAENAGEIWKRVNEITTIQKTVTGSELKDVTNEYLVVYHRAATVIDSMRHLERKIHDALKKLDDADEEALSITKNLCDVLKYQGKAIWSLIKLSGSIQVKCWQGIIAAIKDK